MVFTCVPIQADANNYRGKMSRNTAEVTARDKLYILNYDVKTGTEATEIVTFVRRTMKAFFA